MRRPASRRAARDWDWARLLRPTMPVMSCASTAGTSGADVFTLEVMPPGRRTASRGVPKTVDTVRAVPLTGSRSLPGAGVPTVRPWARRVALTCVTSAALGPNAEANCADVR